MMTLLGTNAFDLTNRSRIVLLTLMAFVAMC